MFQSVPVQGLLKRLAEDNGKHLHVMWDLMAFCTSPPRTCKPGQKADRESIVAYAWLPVCMLTFRNYRTWGNHQDKKRYPTHPMTVRRTGVSHHSGITFMPYVKELYFTCGVPTGDVKVWNTPTTPRTHHSWHTISRHIHRKNQRLRRFLLLLVVSTSYKIQLEAGRNVIRLSSLLSKY